MAGYMEELRTRTVAAQDSFLDAICAALGEAEAHAVQLLSTVPPDDDKYRGWLAYQYARAVKALRCSRTLIASGHALEAIALIRTMIEALILVRWVAIEPATRLQRSIVGETMHSRRRTATTLKEFALPHHRETLTKVAESPPIQGQDHLPSLKAMAAELPDGLYLYSTLYSLASDLTHGHGPELQYLAGATGTKVIVADLWPTQMFRELGAVLAYMVFRELVNALLLQFGIPEVGEFRGHEPLTPILSLLEKTFKGLPPDAET